MINLKKVMHISELFITLTLLWLLLSGHYSGLLLFFGFLSVSLVVLICIRMKLIAYEQPLVSVQTFGLICYFPWLIKEIIKSNISVILYILNPKISISPQIVKVKSTQVSELAYIAYANSITLTPGTVSINIDDDEIEVHSLSKEGVDFLMEGQMNERIRTIDNKKYV